MISRKQLDANRKNAKKGGPKTPAGKLASKYNARKHGLLSKEVLLPWEDGKVFARHGKFILTALKPQDEVEYQLAVNIVILSWKAQRGPRVEKNIMEQNYWREYKEALKNCSEDPKGTAMSRLFNLNGGIDLERVTRYEANIASQLHKALQAFMQYRSFRIAEEKREAAIVEQDSSQAE